MNKKSKESVSTYLVFSTGTQRSNPGIIKTGSIKKYTGIANKGFIKVMQKTTKVLTFAHTLEKPARSSQKGFRVDDNRYSGV